MFTKREQKQIADRIVNKSLSIGQKSNPHFEKFKNKYKWLRGTFTFKQAKRKSGMSEKKLNVLLKKFQNPDYGPLVVKNGKKYHVKEKIGHIIYIVHHPSSRELAKEMRRVCWKNGAHVFMSESSMAEVRERFQISSLGTLSELPMLSKMVSKSIDFTIHLEMRDWAAWSKGIPVKKIKARAPSSKIIRGIEDKRGVKWLLMGWPHEQRAKDLGIPYSKLKRLMHNTIMVSYERSMLDIINKYSKAFRGSKTIRITADDGTNLRFSVKGRRFLEDDGILDEGDIKRKDVGMNIPCGEIFAAPVENSANGTLVIPRAMIPGQGMAHELKMTFKNGRVIKNTAKKGNGLLNKFLAQNSSDANKIAEFGIGCNKAAKFTGGDIIIDEKILGSIHVAIGWNKGYGGKTNASSHLDFIKDLRQRNGKVFSNGKLTINKGKLVK